MTHERIYGVDFAKVLASFLVILLHLTTCGGAMYTEGTGHYVSVAIQSFAYCCVDLFALISGYVGIYGNHSLKKFFRLWIQAFVIGIAMLIVMHFGFGIKAGFFEIRRALMPVLAGEYWYFTAYTVLYFLMPVLNSGIRHMRRRTAIAIAIALFVALSVCSIIDKHDVFRLDGGYSAIWLIVLYVIGAVIRLHQSRLPKMKFCLAGLLISTVLSIVQWLVHVRLGISALMYISPFVILTAMSLLLVSINLELKREWFCRTLVYLSPMAFGIYLVAVHPMFFYGVFRDRFRFLLELSPPAYFFAMIGCTVAIYVVSLVPVILVQNVLNGIRWVPKFGKW